MTDVTDKVERAIARFDRVTRQLDERDGPARAAARRERQRLNAGLGRTAATVALAVGAIWLAAIVIGLVQPIGMFGFLGAILLSAVVAAVLILRGGRSALAVPAPSADLPNAAMVERFDSYVYRTRRALPAPAQSELDGLTALLPSLKQTLGRIDTLDPSAQDARRLMSIHLPGLIERYMNVPPAYRGERDSEGKTVDERLIEGLSAGRTALGEVCDRLARADVAALEVQGRFIEARYRDGAELARPADGADRITSERD
ncbi:MAG TPA: hypothetical protein VM308_10350 [Sphingomicrobium sp.]|nr:hypothetical protein [Sphingomicrobium sp.]